jgi:hypothetical protein
MRDTGPSHLFDAIAETEGDCAICGHDYWQGISGKWCIRCGRADGEYQRTFEAHA